METSAARLRARVFGLVQGVNFRYTTRERAAALGLKGWVRNEWDGSVAVEAEGPRPALEQLLDFLHHGPRHAEVERVDTEWLPAAGDLTRFEIRS
ncbi:MAG: acylphosphatase [Anaerolineales bacterium]|nr:acylphosphatase [Anaerolineales bacterium]